MTSIAELTVRRAVGADVTTVWEWRNDPYERTKSFSMDDIPWSTHQRWYLQKLADSNCHFFLMEFSSKPIGQLRVDINPNGSGEVSIFVGTPFRNQGYAAKTLNIVFYELRGHAKNLVAHVKPENISSAVLFLKNGFQFIKCIKYKGTHCYELKREYE